MLLIRLASRARQVLRRLASANGDARTVRRAQILLAVDSREPIKHIAQRFGRSRQAIYALIDRYRARRGRAVAERLQDEPRSGRPATKRQRACAVLRDLLAQSPRRYRYRSAVWSVPMLRTPVQRRLRCSLSLRTIRRALHQLRYRFKRPRYSQALRPPTWGQVKGG